MRKRESSGGGSVISSRRRKKRPPNVSPSITGTGTSGSTSRNSREMSKKRSPQRRGRSHRSAGSHEMRKCRWFVGVTDPLTARSPLMKRDVAKGTFAVCLTHEQQLAQEDAPELYLMVKTCDDDEDVVDSIWAKADADSRRRYGDRLPGGGNSPMPVVVFVPIRRNEKGYFCFNLAERSVSFAQLADLLTHYINRPLDMIELPIELKMTKPYRRDEHQQKKIRKTRGDDYLDCGYKAPKIGKLLLKPNNKELYLDKMRAVNRGYFGMTYEGRVNSGSGDDNGPVMCLKEISYKKSIYANAVSKLQKPLPFGTDLLDPYEAVLVIQKRRGKVLYAVSPFYRRGSLDVFLRRRKKTSAAAAKKDDEFDGPSLRLRSRCEIVGQVATAMAFIERAGLCHYNLGARNVMVDFVDGQSVRVKVTDYFLPAYAIADPKGPLLSPRQGRHHEEPKLDRLPYEWMALESLAQGEFNIRTDVWAYGIFVCEVFMDGEMPYREMFDENSADENRRRQMEEAQKAAQCPVRLREWLSRGQRHPLPDDIPTYIGALAQDCWFKDPKRRPNFASLAKFWRDLLFDWTQGPNKAVFDFESRRRNKRLAEAEEADATDLQ